MFGLDIRRTQQFTGSFTYDTETDLRYSTNLNLSAYYGGITEYSIDYGSYSTTFYDGNMWVTNDRTTDGIDSFGTRLGSFDIGGLFTNATFYLVDASGESFNSQNIPETLDEMFNNVSDSRVSFTWSDSGTSAANSQYTTIIGSVTSLTLVSDCGHGPGCNCGLGTGWGCGNGGGSGQGNPPVPEPTTMLLFGTGLVGLIGSRIRKKKK